MYRNMIKKTICFLLICSFFLFTVSCQSPEKQETKTNQSVEVTDALGRVVSIQKEPKTIVSGYYISTSILLALGLEDKLVGIEAKADKRPLYQLAAPSLPSLPSVGSAKDFDLERCASLNPDLVILPAKLKDTVPLLEELGLTVLVVNPENQKLLTDSIKLLGKATKRTEQADALLSEMDCIQSSLSPLASMKEKPLVYISGNSDFLSTAGPQMYQDSLITNAGARNVASSLTDSYWSQISYEQLLAWDPDYIILAADASYDVSSVLNDPNLAECKAVKEGAVYQFPNFIEAFDAPIPGGILGSLWLSSILHPEIISPELWANETILFYETFYQVTVKME